MSFVAPSRIVTSMRLQMNIRRLLAKSWPLVLLIRVTILCRRDAVLMTFGLTLLIVVKMVVSLLRLFVLMVLRLCRLVIRLLIFGRRVLVMKLVRRSARLVRLLN